MSSLQQLELALLVDFSMACPQQLVHECFARLHLGDLVSLELQLGPKSNDLLLLLDLFSELFDLPLFLGHDLHLASPPLRLGFEKHRARALAH